MAHTLVSCISLLCTGSGILPEDAQLLAIEALLPAHHPAILEIIPNLWVKIVKHLKLVPEDFCTQYTNKLKNILIDHYKVTAVKNYNLYLIYNI